MRLLNFQRHRAPTKRRDITVVPAVLYEAFYKYRMNAMKKYSKIPTNWPFVKGTALKRTVFFSYFKSPLRLVE